MAAAAMRWPSVNISWPAKVAAARPVPCGVREVVIHRRRACGKIGLNVEADGLTIAHVHPRYAAARTGQVFVGDRILSVNGMEYVPRRGMLETAGCNPRLQLCNTAAAVTGVGPGLDVPGGAPLGTQRFTRTVVLERRKSKQFELGLNIDLDGLTIARVLPGTAAARSGQIFSGDRILRINGSAPSSKKDSTELLAAASRCVIIEVSSVIRKVAPPQPAVPLVQIQDAENPMRV